MTTESTTTLPTPSSEAPPPVTPAPAPKKTGRPKGSKNKKATPKKVAPKKGKTKGKAKGKPKGKTKGKVLRAARVASNLTSIAQAATIQALAPRFAQAMAKGPHNSYASLFTTFRELNPDIQIGDLTFRRLCRDVGVTSSHRLDAFPGSPLAYHLSTMYDPKVVSGRRELSGSPVPFPPSTPAAPEPEGEIRFDNEGRGTSLSGPIGVHPGAVLAAARQNANDPTEPVHVVTG